MVMKDGLCAEYGRTGDVIGNPKSEYTKTLLRAAAMGK